jgi:DNA-binding HxlR family transcriptional regulator
MSRKRFSDMNCGVAQALEQVGDWWTLLIIRDAFLGTTRFADFEQQLGIAKNILSDRLQRLVGHGILARQPDDESRRRHTYRLTEKGRDLWLVLTALRLWSDKWVFGPGHEPILVRDRETGAVVSGLRAVDAQGNPLEPRRLGVAPGPGASAEDRLQSGSERSEA